jgi:hypothetical protein
MVDNNAKKTDSLISIHVRNVNDAGDYAPG